MKETPDEAETYISSKRNGHYRRSTGVKSSSLFPPSLCSPPRPLWGNSLSCLQISSTNKNIAAEVTPGVVCEQANNGAFLIISYSSRDGKSWLRVGPFLCMCDLKGQGIKKKSEPTFLWTRCLIPAAHGWGASVQGFICEESLNAWQSSPRRRGWIFLVRSFAQKCQELFHHWEGIRGPNKNKEIHERTGEDSLFF